MQTNPFTIDRNYEAPNDIVWQAITDKDKMKQWYFELPEFKPEVGLNSALPVVRKTGLTCIYVK